MLNKVPPYDLFKEFVEKAAHRFEGMDRRKTVRVISHIDSDGISAASILLKTLNRLKFRYSVTFVNTLDTETIKNLSNEDYSYYAFTDLGSGQLKSIISKFKDKTVFVLDHHVPENARITENVVHINPMLFNIDGSLEISGSGVVYNFCRNLDKHVRKMAYVALIGAIGDKQENNGFSKLNKEILDEAIEQKKIEIEKGVRFFGRQTRPLHKLLEYSTDPYIPGVSGSSKGTEKFLDLLKISNAHGNKHRKIFNLTEDEMKTLIKGIIKKRKNEKNPKDIFGNIYTLSHEDKGSPLRDAKEFSTLLNACGRLGKASLGVGVCLNDKKSKKKAIELLQNYKKELLEAIRWYEKNKGSDFVMKGNGFLIINAQANIIPTLAGTLASILSNSSETDGINYILTMAQNVDATTKISLRYAGNNSNDVDLRSVLKKIIKRVKGETGGHKQAAGAIIPTEVENDFIKTAKEVLTEMSMEEKVS